VDELLVWMKKVSQNLTVFLDREKTNSPPNNPKLGALNLPLCLVNIRNPLRERKRNVSHAEPKPKKKEYDERTLPR
jgi:hypothetical protein